MRNIFKLATETLSSVKALKQAIADAKEDGKIEQAEALDIAALACDSAGAVCHALGDMLTGVGAILRASLPPV